jgi:hypothetical protein
VVTVLQALVAMASVGFGLASAVLYGLIPGPYAIDAVIAAILIVLGGVFNLWAGFNNSVAYVRKVLADHRPCTSQHASCLFEECLAGRWGPAMAKSSIRLG